MNYRDLRYIKTAAKIAEHSTYARHSIGCVVVYRNTIISTGCNKDRTDPLQKKYNKERNISDNYPHKIHAEVDAIKHIIDLDIDWKNVSIYIVRLRKDQPYGMARPCKSCMSLIKDLGIRNIYYTTNDGIAHERLED